MCRLKQKRNALFVILVGSILAALICSECFILNTTASVPRGLWLKLDTLPQKGDFVQVPIDAFSSTEWFFVLQRELNNLYIYNALPQNNYF